MLRTKHLALVTHLSWRLLAILSACSFAFADPPPCDPLSKYTDNDGQWFPDNKCRTDFDSNCLFYTKDLTPRARAYAATTGQITVWDIWPSENYQKGPDSPLRCILNNKAEANTYFETMCTWYARLCDVYAQVMDPVPSNPGSSDLSTFWLTVEFPAIKAAAGPGRIDIIDGIDTRGGGKTPIYNRNIARRAMIDAMARSIALQYNETTGEVDRVITPLVHPRDGSSCGATLEASNDFDGCSEMAMPW